MAFNDSKYTTWYFKIIAKAQAEQRTKGVIYYEGHHIMPKACGGSNAKINIVLLTPREHLVCHLLLVKMTDGNAQQKMKFALRRMAHGNGRKLTAWEYDYAKRMHAEAMSEHMTGRTFTDEHKANLKIARANQIQSEETKAKRRASLTGRTKSVEARANMSKAQRERVLSPEAMYNIRAAAQSQLGKKRGPYKKRAA